jgi:hypothetical protein
VKTRTVRAMLSVLLAPALSQATELKQQTVQAWEAYVRDANTRMEGRASGQSPFLWVDEKPERVQRVRAGEILVAPAESDNPRKVPHGLIHDWIGAMFLPNAKLEDVMRVLGDYDRYKDFYKPLVVKSKLLERTDDHEKVTLLMMQKAFSVTAAVETENEVRIVRPDSSRAYSLSNSIRVQEIADCGAPLDDQAAGGELASKNYARNPHGHPDRGERRDQRPLANPDGGTTGAPPIKAPQRQSWRSAEWSSDTST